MNVGIIGYGIYVPRNRISISDISKVWKKNPEEIQNSLGVTCKSVAGIDEDSVTMAYEAAKGAIERAGIDPSTIEACFVGSESHPYAVNPTSTIVGEFLGIGRNYLAVDLEFACKAATAGMMSIAGLIASGKISCGLIIGSDTAQAKPHDILEYTAASAACAYVLGPVKDSTSVAEILFSTSYSSDTPDFWRRDGIKFPSHGGRFTGEPAYFAHVEGAANRLLNQSGMKPGDFAYCVFHMPNGKFPRAVAKRLGFTEKQLAPSLIIDKIGNPYCASTLTGLAAILDIANPGSKIFMVSYGSGAGSDGFIMKAGKQVSSRRNIAPLFSDIVQKSHAISYIDYLKFGRKI